MKHCPNNLIKTMLVSLPRSGHHLLVRGLEEALNHKLVYSEKYNCVHNMETCEYVNLQKDHDFNLDLEIDPELNYIVLTRNFDDSMKSWWTAKSEGLTLDDFKESKRAYYRGFKEKWGVRSAKNVLVFPYELLVEYKAQVVQDCAIFMGCEHPDIVKINDWANKENRPTFASFT